MTRAWLVAEGGKEQLLPGAQLLQLLWWASHLGR